MSLLTKSHVTSAHCLSFVCVVFLMCSVGSFEITAFILFYHSCYSMIGMTSAAQALSIGRGCNTKGVVMHEMMHAVRFWHEQSRLDRDNYITIIWRNIRSGECILFSVSYFWHKRKHVVHHAMSSSSSRQVLTTEEGK